MDQVFFGMDTGAISPVLGRFGVFRHDIMVALSLWALGLAVVLARTSSYLDIS